MGDQVFPESYFCGSVVVADPRLQPNVQIQLVVWVILGPGDLLKAIGLGVDELGVLRHWLVRVPVNTTQRTLALTINSMIRS